MEIADLPAALARIEGGEGPCYEDARGALESARRALICGRLPLPERGAVRTAADRAGVDFLGGREDGSGTAPVIVLGCDDDLLRMADRLEALDRRELATGVRRVVEGRLHSLFVLPFADGGTLALGSRTRVMGVLNVTPDSFSDGGQYRRAGDAVNAAARMAEEGADLVDVGGESTRPGATPVPADEEIRRVVPIIEAIKARVSVRVCVDTTKALVARAAIDAGADLVNDVSAFSDPAMMALVRDAGVPVAIMHMRGTPRTMQQDTAYADLVGEVLASLRRSLEGARTAGIPEDRVLVDPGIGFGKSAAGSLEIVRLLPALRGLGRPILVGASRKSFLGAVLGLPVEERLEGSLAVAAIAAWQGAHVVRAHDVAATVRAVRTVDAIRGA